MSMGGVREVNLDCSLHRDGVQKTERWAFYRAGT
jgi:hypothetical protein